MTLASTRAGAARRAWDRVPAPTDPTVRRLAVASLVSQIGIVVTGGAVRLTGSGLGCPTVPRCTDESLVPTAELGVHGVIEFANRLLTFVLAAIAAAMLLAIWRTMGSARPRRDLLIPAFVLLLVIPTQALIGMTTVWTLLNPWVVMLHFMCSAALEHDPAAVGRQHAGQDRLSVVAAPGDHDAGRRFHRRLPRHGGDWQRSTCR